MKVPYHFCFSNSAFLNFAPALLLFKIQDLLENSSSITYGRIAHMYIEPNFQDS